VPNKKSASSDPPIRLTTDHVRKTTTCKICRDDSFSVMRCVVKSAGVIYRSLPHSHEDDLDLEPTHSLTTEVRDVFGASIIPELQIERHDCDVICAVARRRVRESGYIASQIANYTRLHRRDWCDGRIVVGGLDGETSPLYHLQRNIRGRRSRHDERSSGRHNLPVLPSTE
jgi:hypothetical protein